MVPAEGYVNIETFDIETSTVRLDPFPTSLNILTNMLESNQLTLGKMTDKTTGVTTATPYFQLIGSGNTGIPNYDDNYVYDSLTLAFPFKYDETKILAGDTATLQTYRVYRLKNFPPTEFDDPCIYSNDTLPLYDPENPLATLSVRLEKQFFTQRNKEAYFKLDNALGRELFGLIRRQDSILDQSNALDFMRYFAGLTIVPDKDNMALLPIDGSRLSLTCHYHLDVKTGTYTFQPLAAYSSGGYYAFPNIEHTPFGLHAVVPAREDSPSGVVYVLKNRNNGVNIDHKNRLHPFYMVYISEDKEVIVNHLSPKELLDRLRLLCKGKDTPDMDICREFNRITRDGKNMQHYSDLLGDAIASIINVKEESDIDSFLSGVQRSLFTEEIRGLDDFELICFLVIK